MEHAPTTTHDAPPPPARWPLFLILMLGLLLRLGWGLTRSDDEESIGRLPDQAGYVELASNLTVGLGLQLIDERFGPALPDVDHGLGQRVYAARMPGYPAFVAAAGSVVAVRVAQALVDTSTILAVYLLARGLVPASRVAPHLAAALVAFNPFLVYFSALLLTETPYTALLAWGMVLLLVRRAWAWPFGLVLLAGAVLVRPSGLGLPAVLGAGAVLARAAVATFDRPNAAAGPPRRRGATLARAALAGVLGAALVIAALLPWALRNERILGRRVWTTTNDGLTAYDGLHPGATGASDQSFLKDMRHVWEMGEVERNDHLAREARRFARENPGATAALAMKKTARTWSPVPLSAEFGQPLYRLAAALFAVPFYALVLVGVFMTRLPRRAVAFLLLPALYFTAVHALSVGSLRYRIPAEPPLAVLAGAGAARLLARKKKAEGGAILAPPSALPSSEL